MSWWVVAAVVNIVIFGAYLAISARIFTGVIRSGSLTANPLALATASIFLTCAVHHGAHSLHMLLPGAGDAHHSGNVMRLAFDHWYVALWDVVGAGVALWYWTLRGRFPALVRGSAMFEDLRERQRQALDIHDNVVQDVATAKLALDLGELEDARAALERALGNAREIITDLLGTDASGIAIEPGDLRRRRAATSAGD